MWARLLTSAMNGGFDMNYFKRDDRLPYRDRPRYCGWKLKPISIWNENEFWGYYLAEYFRLVGREDDMFSGCSEKGTGWARRRIAKFVPAVAKDNAELKEFMDWYFDFRRRQIGDEFKHWTAPVVSFNDLFGKTSPFWKTFLLHKTGYNVYTSSKFESEGARLFRKSNEAGIYNPKNKPKEKIELPPRKKLWATVMKFRCSELKLDYRDYFNDYGHPLRGFDWKVFERVVPKNVQLADENFSEWLYRVMTAIREETVDSEKNIKGDK